MMPREYITTSRRILPPTAPEFTPIASCIRCGTFDHSSTNKKSNMAGKKPPNWFFSKPGRHIRLPSIDEHRASDQLNGTELSQLRKVQEWLRQSYKYPQGMSHTEPNIARRHVDYTLPLINNPSLGTVNGYSVGDFNKDYVRKDDDVHHPIPDSLSSESSYIQFRMRNSKYFGLNPEFTEYMTPNKLHTLRDGVGSIQRPHTPLYSLGQRQKAMFGDQAVYGHIDNNKQTNGQQLDAQRQRIHGLQSELQDLITR
jgi:hypothetical protein